MVIVKFLEKFSFKNYSLKETFTKKSLTSLLKRQRLVNYTAKIIRSSNSTEITKKYCNGIDSSHRQREGTAGRLGPI